MNLTQAEIIQVLRRRSGLNQGTFGAKAFHTSYESGRTKVKNIELGKQKPTDDDIGKMAAVLDVSADVFRPRRDDAGDDAADSQNGICITRQCLDRFPGLDVYVDMLNKAVRLEDGELIVYISDKISGLLKMSREDDVVNL